jgi:hypothetical protein
VPRFSAGGTRSGTNTAGTEYFVLQTNTPTAPARIREIGIGIAVAPTTAPAFYVSKQTATGTAGTTLAGVLSDGTASTSSLYNFVTNSGNGTFSTSAFIRYGALATTAGGMLIWTFYDEPLILETTSGHGVAVVNANASGATTGTFIAYMVWDE